MPRFSAPPIVLSKWLNSSFLDSAMMSRFGITGSHLTCASTALTLTKASKKIGMRRRIQIDGIKFFVKSTHLRASIGSSAIGDYRMPVKFSSYAAICISYIYVGAKFLSVYTPRTANFRV